MTLCDIHIIIGIAITVTFNLILTLYPQQTEDTKLYYTLYFWNHVALPEIPWGKDLLILYKGRNWYCTKASWPCRSITKSGKGHWSRERDLQGHSQPPRFTTIHVTHTHTTYKYVHMQNTTHISKWVPCVHSLEFRWDNLSTSPFRCA